MSVSCPAPLGGGEAIQIAHGGGGRLSAELLARVFLPAFGNPVLAAMEDQATVTVPAGRISITTDSFVVHPLFFPGGDIGKLAVCGTVNDLAVGGARPRWLTAAFILEEGLLLADLERIVASMRDAAAAAGVMIVAGDTKVVERGKGDGVFITTTGVGVIPPERPSLSCGAARPGDAVLVSGTIGDHGIALLTKREGLELESALESDCAALGELCEKLLAAVPAVRVMRDPTRGGVTSTLHEIAVRSQMGIRLDESALPVRSAVRAACELFGFDPLYVANEGKLVAIVPAADAETALRALRSHPLGEHAALIGHVSDEFPGIVRIRTAIGGERILRLLAGEQLPRIC